MALTAKVSNLSAPAAAGDQDSPSLGLDPKAVLAFYGSQSATGGAAEAHMGFGFSGSAAEDIAIYYNSDDGVATSDAVRSILTNAFIKSTQGGNTTNRCLATMSSLGTDKFTANFSATTSGVKHPFLALGGADITNTAAGSVASSTDTSNFSVTGLGFQPDIVFLALQLITGTGTANNTSTICFGVAKSSSARWCTVMRSQNAVADANTARGFFNNRCLVVLSSSAESTADEYDFVSMDAGGFTLSHPTSSAAAWTIAYLAIKGGQWAVGTFNQATSTGVQNSVTGLSFEPVAALLASAGHDTANAVTSHARMSIGAASSTTSREAIFAGDEDAAATMKADSYYATDKIIVLCDEAGGGSPSVLAAADLDSFDADGINLNWTTVDATARVIGYVCCGSNSSGTLYTKELTDVLTPVDTVLKTPSRTLTDVITIVATTLKLPSRTLSEAITPVDTVVKQGGKVLSDTLTAVDTFIGKITARILTEALSLVDTFTSKITAKVFLEGITADDTVLHQASRTLVESLALVASLVKQAGKVLSEVVTPVDTFVRNLSRTLTDVLTPVATVLNQGSRTLSETLTAVDTILKQAGKVLVDPVTMVDSFIRTASRTLSETVTLVSTVLAPYTATFTETLTLVATVLKSPGKLLSESVSLVTSFLRLVNGVIPRWTRIVRTAASLNRTARPSSSLNRTARPSSGFNREDRPSL